MIESFDELFMNEAYLYANKSKDISTQIGAVIVRDKESIAKGYNGPLRGVDDNDMSIFDSENKSFAMEHAERNAFYNCARRGISTLGCTMYVTWAPCAECARAIVQCGIKKVVLHADSPNHNRFLKSHGIDIVKWSGPIIIPKLRFDGKDLIWSELLYSWIEKT